METKLPESNTAAAEEPKHNPGPPALGKFAAKLRELANQELVGHTSTPDMETINLIVKAAEQS